MTWPTPGSRAQARMELRALAKNAAAGDVLSYLTGKWRNRTLTAVLDAAFGSAQGSILYRDAASWAVLGPGTSGNFLKTQGAAANPIWAAASGGGVTATELTLSAHANVTINGGSQPVVHAAGWTNPGSVSLTGYFVSATRTVSGANQWLILWDTTNTRGYVLDHQGDGNLIWYSMTASTNVTLASSGQTINPPPVGLLNMGALVGINAASDNTLSAKSWGSQKINPTRSTTYSMASGTWELYVMKDANTSAVRLWQVDLLTNPFMF